MSSKKKEMKGPNRPLDCSKGPLYSPMLLATICSHSHLIASQIHKKLRILFFQEYKNRPEGLIS